MNKVKWLTGLMIAIIFVLVTGCSGKQENPTDENISEGDAYYERLQGYVSQIREVTDFEPDIAIVLGSGLGDFADKINIEATVDYSELDGFPTCSAEGHKGRYVFGTIEDKKVVIMQGRVHYYEGYEMSEVVLPLRVMKLLGADTVILTNAAGSMKEEIRPGNFVVFTDQIACLVPSPLIGDKDSKLGETFPDTTNMYSEELRELVLKDAYELGITVKEGVYIQASGPQYETPAEMKAFVAMGADVVGMSTAVEAIAANQMGMQICGISFITNMESGVDGNNQPLTHEEVLNMTNQGAADFEKLMFRVIKDMNE